MPQTQSAKATPKKKVSPPEVREANREFLAKHPERGGRLPNPSNPADAHAAAEWRALYADAKKRHQPQTPKAAPAKPVLPCQATKQTCELESGELKCEHNPEKRKFKVVLPGGSAKKRTIEVIAGHSKTRESIKVTTKLKKPLCHDKKHAQRHIIVKQPHNAPEIATGALSLKFDVVSSLELARSFGTLGKVKTLYKHVWPSYETSDVYYVDVDACTTHGPAQAIVKVFPDLSWSIELAVSAGMERKRTSKIAENGHREVENEGGYPMGFEAKVSYTYDGFEQSIAKEFKTTYVESSAWMKLLKISAHWLRKIAYMAGNVTVTFPVVSLAFKYKSTLTEREDEGDVARDAELAVEADPLIGAGIEVDLLALLIKAAGMGAAGLGIACGPSIAEFLLKVRNAAENNKVDWHGIKGKATVKLSLGMNGGITASGSVKVHKGHVEEGRVKVGGKIAFTFEGKAAIEGKVWMVQATAGVSLSGTAGFAMDGGIGMDHEGSFYGGKAYFSGARLEFKFFMDVKITRKPPKEGVEKEAPTKNGWAVTWPAWPDDGEFKKHRFF